MAAFDDLDPSLKLVMAYGNPNLKLLLSHLGIFEKDEQGCEILTYRSGAMLPGLSLTVAIEDYAPLTYKLDRRRNIEMGYDGDTGIIATSLWRYQDPNDKLSLRRRYL